MDRIRLGILQTNHDKSVEVGDAFPDDAHRFRDLFDTLEQRFTYRVYMTIGGEVPADVNEQDAYLITGSPLSVLDDHAFLEPLFGFIRVCDAAKKPLIGTCFGHQAIALALGGTVERATIGWNVGIETTHFSERLPWMKPMQTDLPMYVFHQDQVTRPPAGCRVVGGSKRCPNAAMVKDQHIFTTQAHPEITEPFMRCVLSATRDYFSDDDYAAILASLQSEQHGALFARWAANFFKDAAA